MQMDKDSFCNTLYKTLDPRSGKLQPIDNANETGWEKVLDIKWKGDIHFIVRVSRYGRGCCYVMRDKQEISSVNYFTMHEKDLDILLRNIQHDIDDVENGRYKHKKTLKEKIRSFVEEKGLVSFMNNTKWHELINDIMEKAPWDCVQYKTLFEDFVPDGFWDLRHDEDILYKVIDLSQIEWMKITHIETVRERIGLLVPDKIQVFDHKSLFLEILQKHSIPYEYDETEQTFIVYGYK